MEITSIKSKITKITILKKRYILHLLLSFLLGRIFLMDAISPFAISYLCSYLGTKKCSALKISLTVCSSLAGIATTEYSYTLMRYLLAYVLFGLIYISVSTLWVKPKKHLSAISAFCGMILSGTIYYAQLENPAHNFSMLFFECAICIVLPYMIKTTALIICDKDIFADTTPEDVAGIIVLAVIAMGGFCGLEIGDILLGKALCGTFIMIIAFTGGCAFSVTCGVGLGVIFSLYAFEFNEYAGILGFCGLITGLASGLKRPGIILSFIISTRLLAIYFGGWSDSVFSGYETLISICVFCLVPQSLLLRIKAYFSSGITQNPEFKKYLDMIHSKIKFTSRNFETIASLSQKALRTIPENINDPSTMYELAASKVCKSCGLKFVCWGKEDFDTRDALNKAVDVLTQKGHLAIENMPLDFKRKCIKYDSFANELNKIYFKHKLGNQWQERMEQSQKMLSLQLRGMSDIIENFSEDLDKSITFDKLDESKIMYNMEQSDISCTNVIVVKDHIDYATVTVVVRHKKKDFTELCEETELIISDALKRNMKTESYTCNGNKFTLTLKESERFSVNCSYISIPKNGETHCGDNVLHGKISGGKYVMILSDGMGCGKQAAEQSLTAIELMQQFLNAGFDKHTSLEMINSTLMLRNSETFATIDAVIFDMFTSKVEFIKAGANTTYIKSGNCIKKISSNTLPIGIISSIKAETNEYQARNGDIIIMISDGIHNATDDWFEEYILNMHEESPRMIAKLLADEASRRKKQDDDMTVAVLKITRNGDEMYV